MLYGTERPDTYEVCGDTNNGFVAIWNWARLSDGEHTAVVYDNGVEFDRATFEVATLGEEFVRGAQGECAIENFPAPGEAAQFRWNQATQHLELVGEPVATCPTPPFVPTNLRVTDTRTDWINLAWDALYPFPRDLIAGGYRIYQTRVDSGEEVVRFYGDDLPEFYADDLIPGVEYCFRVALEWEGCVTAASNEVCGQTVELDNSFTKLHRHGICTD